MTWNVNPTERELTAYGDGYEAGVKDGTKDTREWYEAAAQTQHEAYRALEEERDALRAEIISKQETVEYLESELAAARHEADVQQATADSYHADLQDVAYRLNTSYNGGGTVNILRAIARLQNRAL